jgi:hypothetical protein
MHDNVLIPLPGFQLPDDFPWRVGFVSLVNGQLRRLRATGHFLPPRFFGYYFQAGVPVGVGGSWTVSLDPTRPMTLVAGKLERLTKGKYSITSDGPGSVPDFMLVHDRRGGSCWLWSFDEGLRFVEAVEPVMGGWNDAETPRLFGP